MTSLVRSDPPADDLDRLHARAVDLQTLLDARTSEIAALKADLESFRLRYRQEVGLLHDQLDELELAIAEAELGELSKKIEQAAADGGDEARQASPAAAAEPLPRFTSDAVRKLFRDVAKAIHPDLAGDEAARGRRHALMVEANRAYARGDEEQLRWILQLWERSPEAVPGNDPASMRVRFERRVAQIEEQLEVLARERANLQDQPLWRLKVMVDEAAARGKDLVAQMVTQLRRDIMAAGNRLDAMRS